MTPPTALEASALAVEAPPDSDDIFGPSRSFPPRSNRPKPSMISAKLRAKEERKKVIQICTEKLEKIKDPDRNLRRSVCINNTYYKLQDEVRREKQMKHMNGSRCDEDDLRIRNRRGAPNAEQKQRMLDKALESIDKELSAIDANMPTLDHEMLPDEMRIVNPVDPLRSSGESVLGGFSTSQSCMSSNPSILSDELSIDLGFSVVSSKSVDSLDYSSYCKSDANSRCRSRKRSYDDVEDCDVHEVLSQFYMPPTPRLISTIDDDVMLNVVDDDPVEVSPKDEPSCKKIKLDEKADFENGFDKMLEMDTDLNQNKSDFQTLNDFASGESSPKRVKYEPSDVYGQALDPILSCGERTTSFQDKCDEERFAHKRSNKSEFEIILDALRLDDSKEVCEREDLMFFCSKSDKLVGDSSELRPRFLGGSAVPDSCGQAAILGDQQAAGFHGILASLET